ncbi:MAG TPA: hypothetical protein VGD60_12515 [Candidatus Acidoferrales bacterium]
MSHVWRALCLVAVLGWFGSAIQAQEAAKPSKAAAPSVTAAAPAANPSDVASIDAIMAATYDVISGPPTKKRDWDRFRSLFVPGARLIPVDEAKDGTLSTKMISPDEYATMADPYFAKNGFAEREVSRKAERYGNIAQIFSTYESRHDASDAKPFARGINSFQLFYDGKRWWVVTIYWQEETPANPLPKEFLLAP